MNVLQRFDQIIMPDLTVLQKFDQITGPQITRPQKFDQDFCKVIGPHLFNQIIVPQTILPDQFSMGSEAAGACGHATAQPPGPQSPLRGLAGKADRTAEVWQGHRAAEV